MKFFATQDKFLEAYSYRRRWLRHTKWVVYSDLKSKVAFITTKRRQWLYDK